MPLLPQGEDGGHGMSQKKLLVFDMNGILLNKWW